MEFRLPLEEEREQIESLWAYCFEPKGHPFFTWYFSACYEPKDILVGVEKGQVLADVHLRPYTLHVRGKNLATSYIVGLATHPAARRGGVGRALLLASLEEMRRRGHWVNILMPSKAGFYQPHGWDLYCHQWKRTLSMDALRPLTGGNYKFGLITSPDQWELLAKPYEQYTIGLCGYTVRNERSWRRLIEGQLVEWHIAVVLSEEGEAKGYVFYQLGNPTITASEFIYVDPVAQKSLLNYLYNHRSQGEQVTWYEGLSDTSYIFYPDGKQGNEVVPYMTIRLVDVEKALSEVPVSVGQGAVEIAVTDPLATWNKGVYTLCRKGESWSVRKTEKGESQVQTDVGALGLLLMGRLSASELEYQGRLTGAKEAIHLLDTFYPKQKTFINEWY